MLTHIIQKNTYMQILANPLDAQQLCLQWRMAGEQISFVPTMGFFHAGHQSLMREAKKRGSKLVVSRFVNPTQFGPTEDLATYPRNLERDVALAQEVGVDLLFTPEEGSMYQPGHDTWVELPGMAHNLCGLSRPTFFRGVCTVVTKLFLIVQPHHAFFGQKDWQQLAIIQQMVQDLHFPLEVVGLPTVREQDGLAMSSRNAYLSPEERAQAPHFYQGLCQAYQLLQAGMVETTALAQSIKEYWAKAIPVGAVTCEVDYISFVHPDTLAPVDRVTGPTLVAAAIKIGKTRLIDNVLFNQN